MKVILRLEFQHVFNDEEQLEIIEYLKHVPPKLLLNIIGYAATNPDLNYDNFISNVDAQKDIINRVTNYCIKNGIIEKPGLISRESSLRLAEIILSNKEILIDENVNNEKSFHDEVNILKAYLIINQQLNLRPLPEPKTPFDDILNITIAASLPMADISQYDNDVIDFRKLLYVTIVKFQLLLKFVGENEDLYEVERNIYSYFGQENTKAFIKEVKLFFYHLSCLKTTGSYKLVVEDNSSKAFVTSLIAENIIEDEDFTSLKNHPLYKISENEYAVIDFFFATDKFYKSLKFIFKNSFEKQPTLRRKYRDFFSFFNKQFSEEVLMKEVLDEIFNKSYYKKMKLSENPDDGPDYYVRYNNNIYLFENKDILINKRIKSSGDITKIKQMLTQKLLIDKDTPVGIGQLVDLILQIDKKEFLFDDQVNEKRNFSIYPIIIISDRVLEIPGINYLLNQWYLKLIKQKLGDNYNPNFIKNLTIIDIDTLIYLTPYFNGKERKFREFVNSHLQKMNTSRIGSKSYLKNKLTPISQRPTNEYQFPSKLLIEELKDIAASL